jgi:hypothetical protein
MRAIKLVLILLISAVVINFIRGGRMFHIAKALPFSNAPERISLYDWAGVAVLIICAWGLYRLKRNKEEEE